MKQPLFGLVDCNNFFVSCERLFRPDLEGKPVVVMSSNDGCAVARSNEAKAAGITMAAPYFKQRELFERAGVIRFSANFELYGDISRRITDLVQSAAPRIEVYSIDESFLDITSLPITSVSQWGLNLRQQILREIGMPTSIGIAPTKTLAKLASEIAKKQSSSGGVIQITEENHVELLRNFPIEAIWGVGWHLTPKLKAQGIHTALQLSQTSPKLLGQLFGVRGKQLVAELNGISCFPLAPMDTKQKTIMRGRTFGKDTNQAHTIESAIATMATQAAFRLRQQRQFAKQAEILLETNRHKPGYERFWRQIQFDTPTNDTGEIISRLVRAFNELHIAAKQYHRLNVFLHDVTSSQALQTDLLGTVDVTGSERATRRMEALDSINQRFGRGHLSYAAAQLSDAWQPIKELGSPRYVSDWSEIPRARTITKY